MRDAHAYHRVSIGACMSAAAELDAGLQEDRHYAVCAAGGRTVACLYMMSMPSIQPWSLAVRSNTLEH